MNSDQVRWLLSLETQELSGPNRYKWGTRKWGSSRPAMVFWGICVVFLVSAVSSDRFIRSTCSAALLASGNIWLHAVERTPSDYRRLRRRVETGWLLVLCCVLGGANSPAPVRTQTHTWATTGGGRGRVHTLLRQPSSSALLCGLFNV